MIFRKEKTENSKALIVPDENDNDPGCARNWEFTIFEENMPEDWRTRICEHHIPWVESPLRDRDRGDTTGRFRKAHVLILLLYPYPVDRRCAEKIETDVNGCYLRERKGNRRKLVRALANLDESNAYSRYERSKILGHCGADMTALLRPTSDERKVYTEEILDYIEEARPQSFSELLIYAARYRFSDWYVTLCDESFTEGLARGRIASVKKRR